MEVIHLSLILQPKTKSPARYLAKIKFPPATSTCDERSFGESLKLLVMQYPHKQGGIRLTAKNKKPPTVKIITIDSFP